MQIKFLIMEIYRLSVNMDFDYSDMIHGFPFKKIFLYVVIISLTGLNLVNSLIEEYSRIDPVLRAYNGLYMIIKL